MRSAFEPRNDLFVDSDRPPPLSTLGDESVETAFRIGLEQSRYVNVLSDLKTRETVKLMQRDPEKTKVDRTIGSEVAIRDGARALILPTVAEIGGRVRVTAEVIDPHTQTTVWSESADGAGELTPLPEQKSGCHRRRARRRWHPRTDDGAGRVRALRAASAT